MLRVKLTCSEESWTIGFSLLKSEALVWEIWVLLRISVLKCIIINISIHTCINTRRPCFHRLRQRHSFLLQLWVNKISKKVKFSCTKMMILCLFNSSLRTFQNSEVSIPHFSVGTSIFQAILDSILDSCILEWVHPRHPSFRRII